MPTRLNLEIYRQKNDRRSNTWSICNLREPLQEEQQIEPGNEYAHCSADVQIARIDVHEQEEYAHGSTGNVQQPLERIDQVEEIAKLLMVNLVELFENVQEDKHQQHHWRVVDNLEEQHWRDDFIKNQCLKDILPFAQQWSPRVGRDESCQKEGLQNDSPGTLDCFDCAKHWWRSRFAARCKWSTEGTSNRRPCSVCESTFRTSSWCWRILVSSAQETLIAYHLASKYLTHNGWASKSSRA